MFYPGERSWDDAALEEGPPVHTSLTLLAATAALAGGCVAETVRADAPTDVDAVVVADDLSYEPEQLEVRAGEPTVVHLTNEGGIVHDLVLDGWESGHVAPGEAVTVTLPARSATTVAWCSLPGHRDAGMELELVVRPAEDD
jgi:nitrite reductase (NO-forming)